MYVEYVSGSAVTYILYCRIVVSVEATVRRRGLIMVQCVSADGYLIMVWCVSADDAGTDSFARRHTYRRSTGWSVGIQ
jgi:hypothetical protein